MTSFIRIFVVSVALGCVSIAFAQVPTGAQPQDVAGNFQIVKITRDLITAPQFTYVGGLQITTNQRDLWLQVETEFNSATDVAGDVVFKYYVAINGRVLTGEVTHVNIMAGRGLRSVIYANPKVLARFNGGRAVTATNIQNVAVQIVQQGTVKDESSMMRAPNPKWFTTLPQVPGLLLNKNETPFAPLYWDRYEQIKTIGH
jgi:hypothetical protein